MMAMVSVQGTACPETGLCDECFEHEGSREEAERNARGWSAEDRAIPGSWTVVDGNDAVSCTTCGIKDFHESMRRKP